MNMKYILFLTAFLVSTVLASEFAIYNKDDLALTIRDFLRYNSTEDGAIYNINKYKDEGIHSLDYTLVVVKEVHNTIDKVDPVEDRDFPDELLKLKDLNNIIDLSLSYQKFEHDHSWHETYHKGSIKKGYLKNFKSVAELTLSYIKLSQDNINEITSMSNLQTLILNECEFDGLDFKPIKNLEVLENIEIISRFGNFEYGGDINSNVLKYFEELESLSINGYEISQANMDEICSLSHVRYLDLQVNNKINFECLKNMAVTYLDLSYYDHSMDGDEFDEKLIKSVEKLNLPDHLSSLIYHDIDLTEDNYKEIASVTKLEYLNHIVDIEEIPEDIEAIRRKYSGKDNDEELSHYVEYDRINDSLVINDYYQKDDTKYGAKQILNEYKNKYIDSLEYNLVVVKEIHNNVDKVDPVQDRDFPEEIFQFKDLILLTLAYEKVESDSSWHKTYHRGSIKKGYLKNLTSVVHLTLKNINLSQDNINELAALSNLHTLTLVECEFNILDFKPIKNSSTISYLEIISRYGNYEYGGDINADILKYFMNVGHLRIEGYEMTQANMDEICSLKNLEFLTYPVNKNINTECQKNLPLRNLDITYYEHSMDGDTFDENIDKTVQKLNLPKDLSLFFYRKMDLTEENYKEIVSSNLSGLGEYSDDGNVEYKDLDELKKKYSSK